MKLFSKYLLVIVLSFIPVSGIFAQPTDREANYAGSLVRFKTLMCYSENVDKEHLEFALQSIEFFKKLTVGHGFDVESTTDLASYSLEELKKFSVIFTLNAPIIDKKERELFEAYMEQGGGWIGFHDAGYNDKTTDWPWFVQFLGGCVFKCNNWPPQPLLLALDTTTHPVTKNLPVEFVAPANEYFQWDPEPRDNADVDILVSISPKNYPVGLKDIVYGGDWPVVWTNKNYRMVYLNFGHGDEEYSDATQNLLIINAFRWVVSKDPDGNPFDK